MPDVTELNEQEKILLAGAIKAIILADGEMAEAELADLDRIVEELNFEDFDEHLRSFEKNVKTDEDFEFLARNVFHDRTKSLITQILWDLAYQKGYARPEEEKIIRHLQTWWKE